MVTRRFALRTAFGVGAGFTLAAPFISRPALGAIFPTAIWPGGIPSSVGLNVAKLIEAQNFAQKFGGGAGCVIRHGKLVHSWGSLSQRYYVNSAAKSWGSVLLGFAVDDGKVNLGTDVQLYHSTFGATPSSNKSTGWLDNIAIHHLATHTAGLPKSASPSALVAQPGTQFIYSDGGTNWLGAALTAVYRTDLRQLTQTRLLTPLGLDSGDFIWSQLGPEFGVQATARFNGGVSANVDAMARLGYLYLNGGNWNGKQIVSTAFVKLSTSAYYPRVGVSSLKYYGLLWWNNASGGMAGVPRDTYYSSGKNNNHTFVIPSLGIVAVRVGSDGWSNHGLKHVSFIKPIVDAVVG